MYKLFLSLRYLRERAIAFVAIAAVTLCVAMVLVVSSVMGGWLEKIMENARSLLGDIIVDNSSASGLPLYDEFLAEISNWPEIEVATPVIYTAGLMRFDNSPQTNMVNIVGMRLDEARRATGFGQSLYYDEFYPGTTTLEPQGQPVVGLDFGAAPVECDGSQVLPLTPPEPFASALTARRQAAATARRPLTDEQSVPSRLNDQLDECGLPTLPGLWREFWTVDPEEDDPRNDDDNDETEAEDIDPEEALRRAHQKLERFVNLPPLDAPRFVGEAWPGVIIGRDIAAVRQSDGRYERYFSKGNRVTLTLWASSLRGSVDPIPRRQAFRYVDDSRSGVYNIDSQHVYVDFDLLQQLIEWNEAERADQTGIVHARCSQIQIKVTREMSLTELRDTCRRLEAAYRHVLARNVEAMSFDEIRAAERVTSATWQETQQHLIGPVQKERMLVTILFGIVSLVAVALVLCILYMIVLQKTRDIGIIKSVGGSSTGVALIFVIYGAVVGLIGAAMGIVLGTLVVTHINEIQDYLIAVHPSLRVWDLAVYSFDTIPNRVNPSDALQIVLVAIFASTVGSVAAAWRAGIMNPVEALRYE